MELQERGQGMVLGVRRSTVAAILEAVKLAQGGDHDVGLLHQA